METTSSSLSASRAVLAILCAAQLMLIVDVVIVTIALPAIAANLQIASPQLPFVSIAYTLIFGSLLIVAGRAGDLFGRRRLLLGGIAVFTIGSLLSGGAQEAWQLFAARAVQGLGAAAVSPNALALITTTFPEGEERNRALGWWGAVGSAGAIAGQLLGGVITALAGWRWIFLINVPLGVLALAIALRVLPESEFQSTSRPRLDLTGGATLAAGLASATAALSRLPEHGPDLAFLILAALSSALLAGFTIIERRQPAPLVRFSLLQNAMVRAGNGILMLSAAAVGGALFFTSLYLQGTLGLSPLAVGAAFAPVTLIVLLVSPLAGRLVERVGLGRLLITGMALSALGLLGLTAAPISDTLVAVLPGLALIALGSGLSYAPAFIAGTSGVGEEDQGLASGLLNTAQELGAAIGLALLGALAATAGAALGPVAGFRAGVLGALVMVVMGVVLATRIPHARATNVSDEQASATSHDAGRPPHPATG